MILCSKPVFYLKLFCITVLIVLSLVGLGILSLCPERCKISIIPHFLKWLSKTFLLILQVKVEVNGNPGTKTYLIVSNHVSYLDIPVIGHVFPTLFITSLDMSAKKGIGLFIRLSKCLAVDRRRFTTLLYDIKRMSMLLSQGRTLTLFPEATSTAGKLLPFKPALISTAGHAGVSVLPIALAYEVPEGKGDEVYFYRPDQNIILHLVNLLRYNGLKVQMHILNEKNCSGSRKEFARNLRADIESSL